MNTLFQWTGHPFADSGLAFMLSHCRKKLPDELNSDDVAAVSDLMLSVYLSPKWVSAFFSIFPNHAMTQPAFKGREKLVLSNVFEWLGERMSKSLESGGCICCGCRQPVFIDKKETRKLPNKMVFNKVFVPLGGGVPNFFPGGVMGADFCANCVFLIQCAPLAFYTANCDEKRFLLVHSNSSKVMKRWATRADLDLAGQMAMGQPTGPFNEGYRNAVNAFFHIVESVLGQLDLEENDKHTVISLYHFDNYNQPKPTPLKIYAMPAPVFRFLLEIANSPLKSAWAYVVARNYFFVNKDGQTIPRELKEEQAEERKNTRNLVFENLLAGKSISSRLYSKRQRKVYAPWELLALYLKEIRQMEKSRLETLKRVADDIAVVIQDGKKSRLAELETAKSYASFRNVLLRCTKDRVRASAALPLFSFDEYVEQLFPDGAASWRETQDLLLFRLYETLHEWLKAAGVPQTTLDEPSEAEQTLESQDPEL